MPYSTRKVLNDSRMGSVKFSHFRTCSIAGTHSAACNLVESTSRSHMPAFLEQSLIWPLRENAMKTPI